MMIKKPGAVFSAKDRLIKVTVLVCLAASVVGCQSASTPAAEGETSMALQVTSPAFSEGEAIPKKHSCDGEDLSPALAWSGVPEGMKSLALIMDDPDAPAGTFVHWVLYNIPPDLASLPEGVAKTESVPGIGTQGLTGFGRTGYGGPCPPRGPAHRYYFKVYALDTTLSLKARASKADVEKAMSGHVLAQGQLMGKYSR
jgi:Raf kinase inhibitor-like YbhB/YbcL family protein